MSDFIRKVCAVSGQEFIEAKPLSGGDINSVFKVETKQGPFVLKYNDADRYPDMLKKEALGLDLLRDSESFRIPEVIHKGEIDGRQYLMLEFMSSGIPGKDFWDSFAHQLAQLHRVSNPFFGLETDNYIGALPQSNTPTEDGADFYITERLEPQFKLAHDQGYLFSNLDDFFNRIRSAIPKKEPSLLHGDLWNGNYLVTDGQPVLIDPAVAYASREMDLAMMRLFGGFPETVFSMYDTHYPLQPNWQDRIPLWQLYYILVHLNLFGAGYLNQVNQTMKFYS